MKNLLPLLFLVFIVQFLFAQNLPFNPILKPFYHGVASGDPLEDRVIIWTRVTPENETIIQGNYTMAKDTGFIQIVKTGHFETDSSKDFTVKIDVDGLNPNTTYYFVFTALGKRSIIGRTKTTPAVTDNNALDVFKFAAVSCSNYEGGYFNAYNSIAKRNDLNAVIHLGDYIYEYATGDYRNPNFDDSTRVVMPLVELLSKENYRTRYSFYNLDSDLQNLRQQHPLIVVWDDHEFADNAYEEGAENHQVGEGDWEERKILARQVYFEWMPIRGNPDDSHLYRTISYGKLMDLFMLDTRMDKRQQAPPSFDTPEDTLNPRGIMSSIQYDWLIQNIKKSDAIWKVIGNQVVFSSFAVGFGADDPTSYDEVAYLENLFIDSWEGYLLQRNAIIDSIQKNNLNNIVFLSGDSHCSWAFDVTKEPVLYPLPQFGNIPQPNPFDPVTKQGYNEETGEGSHAVEFCTPSLSASNFAEELGSDSLATLFEYLINHPIPLIPGDPNYNPHLKFVDLDQHGYLILDVRRDSVQADFYYTPTVIHKSDEDVWGGGVSSLLFSNRITTSAVDIPAPPKDIQDIPAPLVTASRESVEPVIFSMFPNPASQSINIFYGTNNLSDVILSIVDLNGHLVKMIGLIKNQGPGLYPFYDIDISDLNPGMFILQIRSKDKMASRKFIVR